MWGNEQIKLFLGTIHAISTEILSWKATDHIYNVFLLAINIYKKKHTQDKFCIMISLNEFLQFLFSMPFIQLVFCGGKMLSGSQIKMPN